MTDSLIFVVDPDEVSRGERCQFLESSGYGTAMADDGEMAFHQIEIIYPWSSWMRKYQG